MLFHLDMPSLILPTHHPLTATTLPAPVGWPKPFRRFLVIRNGLAQTSSLQPTVNSFMLLPTRKWLEWKIALLLVRYSFIHHNTNILGSYKGTMNAFGPSFSANETTNNYSSYMIGKFTTLIFLIAFRFLYCWVCFVSWGFPHRCLCAI